jgi:MFS family permease
MRSGENIVNKQKLWTRDFLGICISSFFLFMTFYILVATLPLFVMDQLHGNQQQIGLVMTAFVLAAVLFRPLAGNWVDKFGRKKMVFLSLTLFLASSIMYLGVKTLLLLLALRFLHGIGFGVGTTATGTVAIDLIPEQRKGEGIGYYSMFMSLAMVMGPFVGLLVIEHHSFNVLFILCSIFSLLSFVFGNLTKVPKFERHPKSRTQRSFHWKNYIEVKAVPVSVSGFIMAIAYSGVITFISIYAKELGLGSLASYFFVVFAAMIILSRPFTGRLFDRFNPHIIVYPGIAFFIMGLILLSQAHTPFLFLAAGAVIGLGYGAALPSIQTIAIQESPSHRRGLATSTYFLFFDSGFGLGSFILGVLGSYTSYRTMYLVCALIVAFTGVVYYALHHRAAGKRTAAEAA